VFYECGNVFSIFRKEKISKIVKVNKKSFKIEAYPDITFNLINGCERGLSNHLSRVSKCTLLTDEEAKNLVKKLRIKKQKRELEEKIVSQLNKLSIKKLKEIENIIMQSKNLKK
jgi:transcription termination factor NusB